MDNLWRERVRRVKNQMDENEIDINDCITQLNSCIELLKPRPDNFLFGQVKKKMYSSIQAILFSTLDRMCCV